MSRYSQFLFLFFISLLAVSAHCANVKELNSSTWTQVQSKHFLFVSDADQDKAEQVVKDLELFRHFVIQHTQQEVSEGTPPLRILGVQNEETFTLLGVKKGQLGAFMDRLDGTFAFTNLAKYNTEENTLSISKVLLLHEYVKYLGLGLPDVDTKPYWYDEGLAEYLSSYLHSKDTIQVGRVNALIWRIKRLRSKTKGPALNIDIKGLFKTQRGSIHERDTNKKKDFIARSLIALHYFKADTERQKQLQTYLTLIQDGESIGKAFSRAFSTSFENMDAAITKFIRDKKMIAQSFPIGSEGIELPDTKVETTFLQGDVAYCTLATFLLDMPDSWIKNKKAIAKYGKRRHPNNLELMFATAKYEISQGRLLGYNEMSKLAMLAPKDPRTQAVFGRMYKLEGELLREANLPGWDEKFKEARRYFHRAIEYNPYDGSLHRDLGELYGDGSPLEPLSEGISSLEKAHIYGRFYEQQEFKVKQLIMHLEIEQKEEVTNTLEALIKANHKVPRFIDLKFVKEGLDYPKTFTQNNTIQEDGITRTFDNGDKYVGDWKNNLPNGTGELIRKSGALYKGVWVNGELIGHGEFKSSTGFMYIGEFNKGTMTGAGKIVFPRKHPIDTIKGAFLMGFKHGKVETIFRRNRKQEATFHLSRMQGEVKFISAAGNERTIISSYGGFRSDFTNGLIFFGKQDAQTAKKAKGVCYLGDKRLPFECVVADGKLISHDIKL